MSSIFEKDTWNKYYSKVIEECESQDESTLWWQIADDDAINIIKKLLKKKEPLKVMEPGCGSGTTSLKLTDFIKVDELVLFDISPNALKVAEKNSKSHSIKKIDFLEGNIFDLSMFKDKFDLVWNIGLIEHYNLDEIKSIFLQMYSSTIPGGYIVIGMPNRRSIPILKAALLGSKFGLKYLSFVRGYRNTSEILYSEIKIKHLIESVTKDDVEIQYGGSLMWVGAPNFIVRLMDKFFKKTPFSFLTFFIIQKK